MLSAPVKPAKILIVDNEVTIVDFIEFQLTKWGYSAVTATSIEEALRTVNSDPESKPALAILDIALNQESGVDLALQLVKILPEIRILFISGYVDDIVIDGSLPEGTKCSFLPKIFTADALKQAVSTLVGS